MMLFLFIIGLLWELRRLLGWCVEGAVGFGVWLFDGGDGPWVGFGWGSF